MNRDWTIRCEPEKFMELNTDFEKRVVVHADTLEWKDSPIAGIQRRMIERIGDEVARATTIVRYEPNSEFSPHVHTGGEEFVVLEGVFEDEHGAFPKGSYIRNPPQSSHTPRTTPGCVIFVKLWQFDLGDRTPIVTNFDKTGVVRDANRPGVSVTPLFKDERETVRVEAWEANVEAAIDTTGGAEVFVLEGGFSESGDSFGQHSWLRVPIGGRARIKVGKQGARIWVKNGHLKYAKPPKV